jgi:hypothetical protein
LQHLLPKEPDGKLPPRPATGIVPEDVAKLQANWSGVQVYRESLSIDGSSPGKLLPGYFGDQQMEAIAQVRGMKSFTLTRAPLVTEKGIARLKDCKELLEVQLDGRPLTKAILTDLAALPALKILEGASVQDADIPILKGFKALEELRLIDPSKLTDESFAEFLKAEKIQCLVVRIDVEERSPVNVLRPLPVAPGISFQRMQVTAKGIAIFAGHPKIEWVRLAPAQMTEASVKHLATLPALTRVIAPNARITAKEAAQLAEVKYLESVIGEVSPDGIRALAACPRLRILELHNATDECLADVAKLTKLCILRINGPQLSDAGLRNLKSMKGLLYLRISNAERVTGAAVREVAGALRGCEVRRF